MKFNLRFTIKQLFVATAVVAVATMFGLYAHWKYCTLEGVYQTDKSGTALIGLLADEINNGDDRDYVISRLGPGNTIEDDDPLWKIRRNIEQQPATLTDGFRQSDTFVEYSAAEGFAISLQFRDDKLVNFNLPEPARLELRRLHGRNAIAR